MAVVSALRCGLPIVFLRHPLLRHVRRRAKLEALRVYPSSDHFQDMAALEAASTPFGTEVE